MQLQGELSVNFDQINALVEKQIPEQAKNLADNVTNLEKVAQYCEDIYVNSKEGDKQHLLNETKSYTTQALASIAYQIHVLANSYLMLLDNQAAILEDMNVSMAHFGHEVDIHKEKVARREIGILTTNKCVMRTVKVKKPDIDEKAVKYIRKPVDYSILDDVGHGVKLARHSDPLAKIGVQTVGRQNSYSSTHSSSASTLNNTSLSAAAASNQTLNETQTPPILHKSSQLNGTVRSTTSALQQAQQAAQGHYRAPVAPPSVPSEYLSRQELGIYSSKKELNQSAGGDSLSQGYGGGGMSYRRPSQSSQNNMSLNMGASGGGGAGEYSDTLDRRMANTYMQQFGSAGYPHNQQINTSLMGNNNGSVGYASGKDIGLIRTNLNNIDYATNGTIYRRPQLHPAIYERSQATSSTTSPPSIPPQPHQLSQQQQQHPYSMRTTSIPGGQQQQQQQHAHILPPPPPSLQLSGGATGLDTSNMLDNHQSFGGGGLSTASYLATQDFDDVDGDLEDDDDMIPNWVPINRCLEKVITTYDYDGNRSDELSFKENMYIYVIKKNDDNWYEGIMKNETGNIVQGLYPFNYAKCVKRYVDDARITQC